MSKSDYNLTDRLLHKIALQSKVLAEISFDIENTVVKKKDRLYTNNHVFISGLARSGTTILMQYLYGTGFFTSLTYLDMPFVLMPNIWKRISFKKAATGYKERAHKDGIFVGFDSPEALEEVFWRVFCGEKYIFKDRLKQHAVNESLSIKFKDYINNILINSNSAHKQRYLSKNNNNVLRLRYLQKCMPESHIIIPFREPLQHSFSLLSQHLHFSKTQTADRFSLDYMNWLGHFEFGLNQKSFFLNDEDTFLAMNKYAKNDINFWLVNWKNYYKFVNEHFTENTIFFNYEKFCSNPTAEMSRLFNKIDVISPPVNLQPFELQIKKVDNFDKRLLDECSFIYFQLEAKYNLMFKL